MLKVVDGSYRVIEEWGLAVVLIGARKRAFTRWIGTNWNWAGEMLVRQVVMLAEVLLTLYIPPPP